MDAVGLKGARRPENKQEEQALKNLFPSCCRSGCSLPSGGLCLQPPALDDAPDRINDLNLQDIVITVGIFILGGLFLGQVLPVLSDAYQISDKPQDPWRSVLHAWAGNLLVLGPMATYVAVKLAFASPEPRNSGLFPRNLQIGRAHV